jgi:hypothetical protein
MMWSTSRSAVDPQFRQAGCSRMARLRRFSRCLPDSARPFAEGLAQALRWCLSHLPSVVMVPQPGSVQRDPGALGMASAPAFERGDGQDEEQQDDDDPDRFHGCHLLRVWERPRLLGNRRGRG